MFSTREATADQVMEIISQALSPEVSPDEIYPERILYSAHNSDAVTEDELDLPEIAADLSDRLGIDLLVEEIKDGMTIQEIIDLVEKKLGGQK